MPEINPNALLGKSNNKNNGIILADFTINDLLAILLGGIIISKLYNVGVIKSVLGLFIVLALLHSVFGVDAKVVSELLSDV